MTAPDPTAGEREHRIEDSDPRNPHRGSNPDCTGTLCPACGCCMHCVPGACGCAVAEQCADPDCCCPAERAVVSHCEEPDHPVYALPATPPAVAASTGTSEDVDRNAVCICNGGVGPVICPGDTHTWQCSELWRRLAAREAAARAEERERIAQAIESVVRRLSDQAWELSRDPHQLRGAQEMFAAKCFADAARIAREAGTR